MLILEKINDGRYLLLYSCRCYGGYGRSIFLDEDNEFIPYENLEEVHKEYGVFTENKKFITKEVYDAYKAIELTESVTIDPHKMGYILFCRWHCN